MSTVKTHGTPSGYSRGCRCDDCRTAMKSYRASLASGMAQEDSRHGTLWGYSVGCRCDECREAERARTQLRRRANRSDLLDDDDPRHGTTNAYLNLSCRCNRCSDAMRAARRDYLPRAGHGTRARFHHGCRCAKCARVGLGARAARLETAWALELAGLGEPANHGNRWTGPEIEYVANSAGVPDHEVAATLGRTAAAIHMMRWKIARSDPRTVALAGLPREAS